MMQVLNSSLNGDISANPRAEMMIKKRKTCEVRAKTVPGVDPGADRTNQTRRCYKWCIGKFSATPASDNVARMLKISEDKLL
jgi:hypothetical protein